MRKRVHQLVFIPLALLLALALGACGAAQQPEETPEESASVSSSAGETPEETQEEETQYLSYPVFIDQAFTSEHHTLTMTNPEGNPADFTFTVSYKGETLYTSGAVAPGESAEWDVMEQWSKKGRHTVTITSVPILADGSEGNPSAQIIRLTLNFD